MKRTLTSIAAASMVLGLTVPAAFAATSHTNYNQRTISIGSYSAGLKGIAAKDPWSGANTEFMPIFYLQQGLKALGYTATWNGTTHTLAITTASGSTTGLTKVTPGNGTVITVNGVPIVNAPKALVAKDPASGKWTSYLPIYYLADALKALGYTSSYNGAAGTWVVKAAVGTLAITGAPSSDVAVGTGESLGLTNNGTAVTSGVTWSVSGNGGAVIDQMGNFVASQPGTYTVTASYMGQSATASVVVYGQAVAYKVTSSASNLVADNTTTNTITVTAVDANGNPVRDYSGTADVSSTAGLIAVQADQPSDFAYASGTTGTLTITNGVGTFAVGPTNIAGTTDSVSIVDNNTSSPLATGTFTYSTATSTLSQLALSVATGSPAAISANGQYSTTLNLSAENAQGNTFSGQPGTYVTLSLTGPGSFVGGTTAVTSETVYVPTSGTLPVTVYSLPGQAGNISVSASSTGLAGASVSVPTYINTAAGSISVTSKTGTDASGNTYTLYTVQLLDTNGHPITTTAANDSFTVNDNSLAGGGQLEYGTYDAATNAFSGKATSATGYTSSLTDGIATFAVETNTVGTGTPTVTVEDTTNSFTQTASYSYAAGAAAKVAVTPNATYYTAKAGQTLTFSAQLQDTNSNNVAEAGQPVEFQFVNADGLTFPNGRSTETVDTNANGVASISIALPSSVAAGALQVSATPTNITGAVAKDSSPITVEAATATAAYATQVAMTTGGSVNALSTLSTTAGATLANNTVLANAENALGSTTGVGADDFMLTSSNSNVVSVPSTAVASTSGVADLSGSLAIGQAGSAVITVQDISNPSMPKTSFTVNVNPGAHVGATVEYNGAAISTNNPVTVPAGGSIALQVVNSDASGDPIPVVGSSPMTVNLTTTVGGDFRLTPTGAPVSSVTINPGQSSTTVYWVSSSSSSQTLSSTSDLTATETVGAPATLSLGTVASAAYDGTDLAYSTAVTVKDANGNTITPLASDLTVSVNGTAYTYAATAPTTKVTANTWSFNASTGTITLYPANGGTLASTDTISVTDGAASGTIAG